METFELLITLLLSGLLCCVLLLLWKHHKAVEKSKKILLVAERVANFVENVSSVPNQETENTKDLKTNLETETEKEKEREQRSKEKGKRIATFAIDCVLAYQRMKKQSQRQRNTTASEPEM
jgi:hypothetical protein